MTKHCLFIPLFFLVLACGNRKHDPAPPASSVVIPMGAPRATGAMAAGRTPAPTSVPAPGESEPEDEDAPPMPMPPEEVDSGVAL